MIIVYLARYLPAEGSTTHMYSVAENLIRRGHSVYILSGGHGGHPSAITLFEKTKRNGVKFIKLPFPIYNKINFRTRLYQLVSYLFSIPFGLYYLYKLKPDVIHAHYPVTTYLAAIYKFITGKQFIVTHHNMNIPKHIFNRKGDYAIAISRELEINLVSDYNYKKSEVKLIFNGVKDHKYALDKDGILNLKRINNIPIDRVIIGFVGTIGHRKGVDILIEAINRCKHLKIHAIILGNGNIDWLNQCLKEYQINHLVTLIPFRDPREIYTMIDMLILPSRVEGFPLVPLEAMVMKKPVIRSNIEGANDQIIDGENGFLFESENIAQLAAIITTIALDPKSLTVLGENAYKHVVNHFSEDVMVDKMLEVYNLTT
ncbi:Glycosyl transferase, group 1 [Winogradskyella psychrotolerans RS-3]|uniref:Glycosyl transferase, group 1 n=1 Tax=Winogradskyella psychrotolerans RS-3 TaxID=641526 RepID=S7WVH2_9FLAO|nr:glycosyltransferase family 4 protein [Winogradskyella psychrotolerans]EPR70709.1 Glycosyl transferase, group 1 [Winogradskyella psychrotolerans RS-3]